MKIKHFKFESIPSVTGWAKRGFFAIILVVLFLSVSGWAEELKSKTEEALYLQATQSFNDKKWSDAQIGFEQFQKAFPNSRWKYAARIRLADMADNPETALKLYLEVVQGSAGEEWKVAARWGLAQVYYTLGQYQNAADQFRRLAQNQGVHRSKAFYLAGLSLMALNQPKEAKICFDKVAVDTPWSDKALVGMGNACLALHDPAKATKAYDQYLQKNPDGDFSHEALLGKAQASKALGHASESEHLTKEANVRVPEALDSEKKVSSPDDSENQFTLQVGAFSKKEYATKLVKRLATKGYAAMVVDSRGNQDIFHLVRVGTYVSREAAQKAGEKIEKQEKLPFLIVSVPKKAGSPASRKGKNSLKTSRKPKE